LVPDVSLSAKFRHDSSHVLAAVDVQLGTVDVARLLGAQAALFDARVGEDRFRVSQSGPAWCSLTMFAAPTHSQPTSTKSPHHIRVGILALNTESRGQPSIALRISTSFHRDRECIAAPG
jgi:hypothetical protein